MAATCRQRGAPHRCRYCRTTTRTFIRVLPAALGHWTIRCTTSPARSLWVPHVIGAGYLKLGPITLPSQIPATFENVRNRLLNDLEKKMNKGKKSKMTLKKIGYKYVCIKIGFDYKSSFLLVYRNPFTKNLFALIRPFLGYIWRRQSSQIDGHRQWSEFCPGHPPGTKSTGSLRALVVAIQDTNVVIYALVDLCCLEKSWRIPMSANRFVSNMFFSCSLIRIVPIKLRTTRWFARTLHARILSHSLPVRSPIVFYRLKLCSRCSRCL